VNNGAMRHALLPTLVGVLTAVSAQPALAKPCTYPMARMMAAHPQAPVTPRTREGRNPPCTILQKADVPSGAPLTLAT